MTGSSTRKVRTFVEGRPVLEQVTPGGAMLDLRVPLLPGPNVVSVVSFDEKGMASNPVSTEVESPTKAARPEVWVVAIGVAKYPKLPDEMQLEASDDDARGIIEAFSAQAGEGKTFGKAHTTLLLDEQVTRESVTEAMKKLGAMRRDDVAVVFLAGHGVKLAAGEDMIFVTGASSLDKDSLAANGIGWSLMGSAISSLPGRVLVLLDACHSGHVTQDLVVPNGALADDLLLRQRAGALVFAAAKGRQLSYESNGSRGLDLALDETRRARVNTSGTHGFFTGALLRGLQSASTDTNRDGNIQLSELVSTVTLRVGEASSGQQTPWVARRELFGDFVLARAPAP